MPTEPTVGATSGASGHNGPLDVTATTGIPAFDDHHPPSRAVIDDCVHCGFCMPTCPTYVLWGEEMDSPRGRIYLMGNALDGEPLTPTVVQHFDGCLGCMACVTACPSGVRYDQLIEATRARPASPIALAHTVDVLDASIRALPVSALLVTAKRRRRPSDGGGDDGEGDATPTRR